MAWVKPLRRSPILRPFRVTKPWGTSFAADLLQDDQLLEVIEVRQLLEPAATGLAAHRMTPAKPFTGKASRS